MSQDFYIEEGVLQKYMGSSGAVAIPDSVTAIREGAFACCSSLTSVTIPDSVTAIGSSTFALCSRLTSVTIRRIVITKEQLKIYNDIFYGEIIKMIITADYSVKMNHDVKYDVIWKVFSLCPDDEKTLAYIKENFAEMFTFLIDHDDAGTVQKVIDSGIFLTKRNIDEYIRYAIDNKHHEIQVMLTNYKAKEIGYTDPTENLNL